jgi:hypothetical protein
MGRHARAFSLLLLASVAPAAEYTFVDVQKVPVSGDASAAVVHAVVKEPVAEVSCDVLIAGAGMGGIGAALAVARRNQTACLTEETDWVGGQATSGGVPALDENRFIEIRRYAAVLRIQEPDPAGIGREIESRRLLCFRALLRASDWSGSARQHVARGECARFPANAGDCREPHRRPD